MLLLIFSLTVPAAGLEIEAPTVPQSGRELMPDTTGSFGEALWEMVRKVAVRIRPELSEAVRVSLGLICAVMVISMLTACAPQVRRAGELAGVAAAASVLLLNTNAMIRLAADTVHELSSYGTLLLPVMTAALAAQGGATASVGMYAGTAFFSGFMSNLLSKVFVPGAYLFLALAVAAAAVEDDILKKLKDTIQSAVSWSLKTVLTVFTTYMGITGVVSGTTDAAALKAAKVTISSFVPVVGGILSDASEAVLVSAGVMKNAAGIYGILAVLSLYLGPFVRIGIQYLILKATALLCGIFGGKGITGLIGDFSTTMGLLLGITGSMCLLVLISTVCFMKGVT